MHHDQIKTWVLIALASDDQLMECLVLKGGNAIDLIQKDRTSSLSRASYDVDYSLADDFEDELMEIQARIQKTLESTFNEHGLIVFDYKFSEKPNKQRNLDISDFWGGYNIEFKLIREDVYKKANGDLSKIQRSALAIMPNNSPKIKIDISKYEYIDKKITWDLEGYTIYIYSPEMIALEKLRAICQQLPEYKTIIPSFDPRPRARDFYDIHLIMEDHKIIGDTPEMKELLKHIFSAKRVPISYIQDIPRHLAIHRQDWQTVLDTISAKEDIKEFDFYVDFVMKEFGSITIL